MTQGTEGGRKAPAPPAASPQTELLAPKTCSAPTGAQPCNITTHFPCAQ